MPKVFVKKSISRNKVLIWCSERPILPQALTVFELFMPNTIQQSVFVVRKNCVEFIDSLCWQNAEFLMLNLVVKRQCSSFKIPWRHTGRVKELLYFFFKLGTRWGLGDQRHAPGALPREKRPVPVVQETGWAPQPVWKNTENFAHHPSSNPGPSSP